MFYAWTGYATLNEDNPADFVDRLINEYKEGKAYRYYYSYFTLRRYISNQRLKSVYIYIYTIFYIVNTVE